MARKYQETQLREDNQLEVLHPETDADIVIVEKGTGKYQGDATNVQDALEEIYEMAETGGVTGVKGNEESEYRKGNVNLTPANIGAQPEFTDGSADIASESDEVVTIKAGVSQNGGAIRNNTGSDIVLGKSAKKNYTTSVTQGSNDLVTSGAVWTAIDNLPEPMIFKGSLGTGGTITTLPTASASNEGWVYKVITAGTYAGQSAKLGDLFISANTSTTSTPSYEWVYVPSADEPSGTVTSVGLSTTANGGLTVSNSPVTSSGTMTVNLDTAYGDKKNPYGSKTKNQVLASPANADGIPGFRALVLADIPDLSSLYQPLDADLTAIAGLTGTTGFLKKTANNTWTLDTNTYLTENQNISLSGDASGSGKTNINVTLSNTGVAPGVYSAVQVDAKGRAVAGGQSIEVRDKVSDSTYNSMTADEKALYDSTSVGGYHYPIKPSANLVEGGLFFREIPPLA